MDDGTEFECHRIVLALFSDYFATMFANKNFIEHEKNFIKLSDVDKPAFSAFLDFTYTGEVMFTPDNLGPILQIANMLLTELFKELAINYTKSSVEIDDAVKYDLSEEHALTELKDWLENRTEMPPEPDTMYSTQNVENTSKVITSSYILKRLNTFRTNRELFDVTLLMDDGTEFECHQIVLALFSDYFAKKFANKDFAEHEKNRLKLSDVNKTAFSAFLDFAYTGEVIFTSDNLGPILKIANMLLAELLTKLAINYTKSSLQIDDAVKYYNLSKEFALTGLTKFIFNFIFNNCSKILQNETFLNLPFDIFKIFLTELELEERDYFKCIIEWVKFDLINRSINFDELLENISFDASIDPILSQLSEQNQNVLFEKAKKAKNKSIVINSMVVIQHMMYLWNEMRFNIFSYTRNLNKFKQTIIKFDLEELRSFSKLALLHNELFLCYSDKSNWIEFMHNNFLNNTVWKKCAKLRVRIDNFSSPLAVDQENKIYVSVSPDRFNYLFSFAHSVQSLYCYNADLNNWFAVDKVPKDIIGRTIVAHNNVLYLCGGVREEGTDEGEIMIPTDVITLYDPRMKSAQNVGSLSRIRYGSAAVIHNDSIYITGGSCNFEFMTGGCVVQRYDITAGKTELIPSMYRDRYLHSAASYNNEVWVASTGGYPIETYNEISGLWIDKTWDILDKNNGDVKSGGDIYLFPH